jgi:hypothetical protein
MQNGLFVLDASLILSADNTRENTSIIKIWPVPASKGILNVSVINNYSGIINYKIYDVSGRIIISGKFLKSITNHIQEIAINNLASGSYIIEFSGNDFLITKKFVR